MERGDARGAGLGGAGLSACDHSAMGVSGEDREVECAGCGARVGKFTAPGGAVFTSREAFESRMGV